MDELIWGVSDEINNDVNWMMDEAENLDYEFMNDIEQIEPDYSEWAEESWREREHYHHRYFIFLTQGIPWLVLDLAFQAMNIFTNVFHTHFWAGGNFFLMFNTGMSMFQGLMSFLIVAELPVYMRHMRIVRGLSFLIAFVYNLFYTLGFGLFFMSTNGYNMGGFTTLQLLFDLFFAFNLIVNSPIMMMNLIIILKELQFEVSENNVVYWDFDTHEEWHKKLGISDMVKGFMGAFNLINPIWWFKRLS